MRSNADGKKRQADRPGVGETVWSATSGRAFRVRGLVDHLSYCIGSCQYVRVPFDGVRLVALDDPDCTVIWPRDWIVRRGQQIPLDLRQGAA